MQSPFMGERYSVALLKELPDLNPVRCSINISPLRGFPTDSLSGPDNETNREPFLTVSLDAAKRNRYKVDETGMAPITSQLKPGVNERLATIFFTAQC